ncbi:macrolide transporter subunit MacA [Maioricimonas rarisocia]|uniref:Macrolide transporter subunit MacA n=1 Tax=Maioricimonas rarisocia TaxID=2528026 RepID=A0A517ZF87_9PLAN|nr:hypothetical protein [Maioricimonas rarisocia]QDU41157.1 macrolide transporter subunit MacA [Maioricimonas rarisocia]
MLRVRSCVTLLILLAASLAPQPAVADPPETHEVEPGPFRVTVELDGVFESQSMHEIILQPEVWSGLVAIKAVDQGTRVEEGEQVLWLDTDKIENEIRDLEFQIEQGQLSLEQKEVELATLRKSVPLDIEAAERSRRIAVDDLNYFLETDEDLRRRSAEESLLSAKYSLEYAQEELEQLEKMYRADDLTEETEEIILRRAQRDVDRRRFLLETTRARSERQTSTEIPREKVRLEEAANRSQIALTRAHTTLPAQVKTAEIELARLKHSQENLERKLADLQADLEQMTVTAPADGIVFYGSCQRGKWPEIEARAKQLRKGGTVPANTVLMTIVTPGPSVVRVDVPEKELHALLQPREGYITPDAYPDLRLQAEFTRVNAIPIKDGVFDGTVLFDFKPGKQQIFPGMNCTVTLVVFESEDALTVPKKAVFTDETITGEKHVWVVDDAGGHERRNVTTGASSDNRVQITAGLDAGDSVLLSAPE